MGNHCCAADKNAELLDTRNLGSATKKGKKPDMKPVSKYDASITKTKSGPVSS